MFMQCICFIFSDEKDTTLLIDKSTSSTSTPVDLTLVLVIVVAVVLAVGLICTLLIVYRHDIFVTFKQTASSSAYQQEDEQGEKISQEPIC